MRKAEIAHHIHQAAGISEEKAAALLNWILELLKSTLQKGESISIINFGVFTVRSKASRPGRNPRTRERVLITARRVVVFRASDQLKAEVDAIPAEGKELTA